jgi:hypothetical protein
VLFGIVDCVTCHVQALSEQAAELLAGMCLVDALCRSQRPIMHCKSNKSAYAPKVTGVY